MPQAGCGSRDPHYTDLETALDRPDWWCDAHPMGHDAKSVLDAFEQLSPAERAELALEVLRRAAHEPHEAPDDDELIQAADLGFLDLDGRESQG